MVWDPDEEDRLAELEPVYFDVPQHLKNELWLWSYAKIRPNGGTRVGASAPVDVLLNALRVDSSIRERGYRDAWAHFESQCSRDPAFQLKTIRAILEHLPDDSAAGNLEQILVRGHSGYAVRADRRGLEFRVPPAARAQIERAVHETPSSISQLMVKAWNAAYGLEPHPDVAFLLAVQATEAAARGVISPDDGAARLGKMIRDCEAKPSKWELVITESRPYVPEQDSALDGVQAVIQMLRVIAYGQKARHPDHDSDVNSIHEARAAVNLAVTLVQWCIDGAFRRRP